MKNRSEWTPGPDGFRGVCDHPKIVHKAVPVTARTALLNHWLVCLACGSRVCLSRVYRTQVERQVALSRSQLWADGGAEGRQGYE